MSKLTKQNVGGVDYTTVGCALTATCDSAASDYIKVATLTDGDVISDGMHVVCTFTNGNSAGTSPDMLTIYSSDQVNYYSDDQLTVPFTLAPEGCYRIEYTGTGNAYSYISWVCLSVGGVTGTIVNPCAGEAGGTLWSAGNPVVFLYSGGRFRLSNVGLNRLDLTERWQSNPASVRAVVRNNKFAEFDYAGTPENPIDIYSIASSIPNITFSKTVSIRVVGSQTNSPYGAGVLDGDFHYDIKRIALDSNYIRIIAYDVRNNHIYENARVNGTWQGWYQLQRVETATIFNPVTDGTLHCEWSRVEYRNGTYCLYARFYNSTPVAIDEGAVIGTVGQGLQPKLGFPINIHNFSVNQDYMLWINETDGAIRVYGTGAQTITFDMYLETTYVK